MTPKIILPLVPMLFAIESAIAGGMLVVADIEAKSGVIGQQIYEQLSLLGCCVIGSFSGAVMAIGAGLGNNSSMSPRVMCLQFGTSQLAGMCFTPMIMRYSGLALTPDFVVGCSAVVAVSSVATIQQISKMWLAFIAKKLGLDPDSQSKP